MITRLSLNKILWCLTATVALVSAVAGVVNPAIYYNHVSPDFLPGTVSQDVVTLVLSVFVLVWLPRVSEQDAKKQIILIGIMSYFCYGYGIWVIEQVYTELYLVYLAVLGLSFYSMIVSVASIRQDIVQEVKLPKPIRTVSVAWALINPVIFYPLWIMRIVQIMAGQPVGNAYSVFILDLSFVMPALAILAIMAIRGHGLGLVLLPALFVKGFTLLFSVALGSFIAPVLGQAGKLGEAPFYLSLSMVFLILAVLHLRGLKFTLLAEDRKETLND